MSTYRVTCLTPTLVGSGGHLAPIDYMIWRDQVNVLDHARIVRMWSRSPRLESYLTQVRRAERLDFTDWGGLAQNFAGRRIPLEDASLTALIERTRTEQLFIPTFASQTGGLYLPGSAIKGSLRAATLLDRVQDGNWKQLEEQLTGERPTRHPGEWLESAVLGSGGESRTRALIVSDSQVAPNAPTKVYLLRVATLVARGGRTELGWKQSSRGTVEGKRSGDSTPWFAEMAVPGAEFSGVWSERASLQHPSMLRALRWKHAIGTAHWLAVANRSAGRVLEVQKQWAETAGLATVAATAGKLLERLREIENNGVSCLLSLGWGGGLPGKAAFAGPGGPAQQAALKLVPGLGDLVRSGLPVPKTRRIVFLRNHPATLPGWVQLDLID